MDPTRAAQQNVTVQLVDDEGKAQFKPVELSATQLPASFEARTTMRIAGDDWEVVEARPMTVAEFSQTGKLLLRIHKIKIVTVPTKDLLYSRPTITERLPTIEPGTSKLQKDVLELHTDSWRQVEWISARNRDEIIAELAEIAQILEAQRVGYGFKSIHVRKALPTPIESPGPTLAQLQTAIGDRTKLLDGVGIYDAAGLVENGFALRLLSSIELYGQTTNQELSITGFKAVNTNNVPQPDIDRLAMFAAEHDLLLVNWCDAQVVEATEADYRAFFIDSDD